MTAASFAEIAHRLAATADLPIDHQADALVGLLTSIDHAELAPFTALLIGEVVALRARLQQPSRPSLGATPSLS